MGQNKEYILPPQLQTLAALCSKPGENFRYAKMDGVQIEGAEEKTTFTATNGKMLGILTVPNNQLTVDTQGRFPADPSGVIPKGKPDLSLRINARMLVKALRAAIAAGLDELNDGLSLAFHKQYDQSYFVVIKSGSEGREFTGVVVSLMPQKDSC